MAKSFAADYYYFRKPDHERRVRLLRVSPHTLFQLLLDLGSGAEITIKKGDREEMLTAGKNRLPQDAHLANGQWSNWVSYDPQRDVFVLKVASMEYEPVREGDIIPDAPDFTIYLLPGKNED